jgi:hypothetical protein
MIKQHEPLAILGKQIDLARSPTLCERPFTQEGLATEWNVRTGTWCVEGEWLTGRNPESNPGMIVSRADFFGNVLLEFEARTIPPSTHDIDFMISGSWDEEEDERGEGYVIGLWGWWEGKTGIEKSPDYKLWAATPVAPLEPGRVVRVCAGNIDGHVFVFVDDRLIIELTDPNPIDTRRCGKIGFEAYASMIQFRRLKVRQIVWEKRSLSYATEV